MLENESDALITLGMLLRRNRTPQLQREVERILRSGLSSGRKIEAIRRLDAERGGPETTDAPGDGEVRGSSGEAAPGDDQAPHPAGPPAAGPVPAGPAPSGSAASSPAGPKPEHRPGSRPDPGSRRQKNTSAPRQPGPAGHRSDRVGEVLATYRERILASGIDENRARLKRVPAKASLFRFVFSEYGRLRRFGRDRRVLSPRLFPPGVRVHRDAVEALETALKPAAPRLLELLEPALSDGWLLLSKRSYNLLVTLRELCRAIAATDFASLQLDDPELIDRLEHVEIPFLVLRSDPEYPSLLVSAFRTLAGNSRTADRRYADAPELIRRLLSDDGTLPSLRDVLLGLNMVRSRCCLDPEELVDPDTGPLVDSERFRCDPPIGIRIDEHVRKALARLIVLRNQVREIARVRTFLEPSPGEPAELLLADLYDSRNTRNPSGRRFQTDRKNITLFLSGFLDSFLAAFERILDGDLVTLSGKSGRMFEPGLFGRDILRLRQIAQRFRHLAYSVPGFSSERFLRLSASGIGVSGAESEIILFVQEVAAILREIARKLTVILARRIPSGGDVPEARPGQENRPAADSGPSFPPVGGMILQGRPARLPFENERIASPPFLNGRRGAEALASAVSICYAFCREVQDRPLAALLKRERGAAAELRGILDLLERIAPPETYRQARDREL